MGWSLRWTTLIISSLVILYTVSGGSKAVNQTQKLQMVVIMGGMFVVFMVLLNYIPDGWSFSDASIWPAKIKMNVIDTSIDLNNRYTVFSGILGSVFLFLAYFGTDQSQVQRYLTGRSIAESRMGLLFNGLLKIPMQFLFCLLRMVFIFYQFHRAPIFFNENVVDHVYRSKWPANYDKSKQNTTHWYPNVHRFNRFTNKPWMTRMRAAKESTGEQLQKFYIQENDLREQTKSLIKAVDASIETNDRDYVFLHFFLHHLPRGLVGLLLAVIFSAASLPPPQS
ncbi:MAG: hypothetical protein R2806_16485 [Saprospiraceae bacterium]